MDWDGFTQPGVRHQELVTLSAEPGSLSQRGLEELRKLRRSERLMRSVGA
ncbi:hypothetical protein [Mycolicibacterium brumae]|nr:hypothetical protein MBRU_10595 [Mycolicibacterium brumae DSM 44177]